DPTLPRGPATAASAAGTPELRENREKPEITVYNLEASEYLPRVRSHPEYRDDGAHGRVPFGSGKEADECDRDVSGLHLLTAVVATVRVRPPRRSRPRLVL